MKLKVLTAGIVAVMVCLAGAAAAQSSAPRISKEDAKALLGKPNVVFLDARVGGTWSGSNQKVKGAVRVDPDDVKSWAGSYKKDTKLIVYCSWANEGTSASVVLNLQKMGFTNAFALKGGWWEWSGAGYPVEAK